MDKFVIKGKKKLSGEIEVRGSKNAAGPVLAACILTDEECIIDNLPLIEDIFNILEVFKSIGAKVEMLSDRKVKIKSDALEIENMDFAKASKTRMSVLLFGSLISRAKHFKMAAPGGDKIGLRPISVHLKALEQLGAEIKRHNDYYTVDCNNLKGSEIILDEFSVTATETVILAAVLADGKTVIKGAAEEPHIHELEKMLKGMGANINRPGSNIVEIEGVKKLKGNSYEIPPDPIEAATLLVIGAVVPGKILIRNAGLNEYFLFLKKMEEVGINFKKIGNNIEVSYSNNLKPVKIQAMPHPGFPTDFLPVIVPLLLCANGKSLIHDPLYENRFGYLHELRKMGGDIEIVDPHRSLVFGPRELKGMDIDSLDIRAGASLVVAALMAEGETIIHNVFQIDRGYERIEERLQKLGADIKRITN